jgi:hypothetical protein
MTFMKEFSRNCFLSALLIMCNYHVSILNGRPLTNLDRSINDNILTPLDLFIEVAHGASTSGQRFASSSNSKTQACLDVSCLSADNSSPKLTTESVNKTYWYPVTKP